MTNTQNNIIANTNRLLGDIKSIIDSDKPTPSIKGIIIESDADFKNAVSTYDANQLTDYANSFIEKHINDDVEKIKRLYSYLFSVPLSNYSYFAENDYREALSNMPNYRVIVEAVDNFKVTLEQSIKQIWGIGLNNKTVSQVLSKDDKLSTEQEKNQQEAIKQPQQPTGIIIPNWLQEYKDQLFTNRANKYFPLAVAHELIEQTPQGYKKHSDMSKALLAYFLQRVYIVDGAVFPDTALNKLFGESNLKQAVYSLSGNRNADGKPRQYQKVDAIFDEA